MKQTRDKSCGKTDRQPGAWISRLYLLLALVMLVLTLVCIWLTHDLKVRNISKRQAVAEKIVITAENFVRNNMGEAWMRYVPFVSTIFAMSIFSSLSSLVGLWPPTADVSTTLAWGIVVFVIITYTKLRTNGLLGYLKGFCDPIFVMAPFNVLGEVFTPISMAFRHFGNIVSGTVISTLVYAALVVANHALFSIIPGVVGQWRFRSSRSAFPPSFPCTSTGSAASCRRSSSAC